MNERIKKLLLAYNTHYLAFYVNMLGNESFLDKEAESRYPRHLEPEILAEEICKVQPMSSPYSKEEWPYQVDALLSAKFEDVIPMKQWCKESLNEGEWAATVQYFAFKNEEAYSWFGLRWL
jgi:hypothetical protein